MLVDALLGAYRRYEGWAEIKLYVPNPTTPLRMDLGGADNRQAVLSPFRNAMHDQPTRFSLDEFIEEIGS